MLFLLKTIFVLDMIVLSDAMFHNLFIMHVSASSNYVYIFVIYQIKNICNMSTINEFAYFLLCSGF